MRHVFISLLLVVTALQGTVARAASLTAEFVDGQGKPLSDAVLTLRGANAPPAVSLKADMDQRDVQFAPHVLAVRSGT
ncbi:hypothetical protein EC919_103413 [Pseudomonas graminis]|nr:hypothetical protein EC919_103413 [Pseudomonas graminis]